MHKKLLPAYFLTFVNVLGVTILMPVLPFIVERYNSPEWVYGLLISLYSAFQFFGSPYLGAMSDRLGRKPVLLISQAGTLLCWIVFLIALSLPEYQFLGMVLPLWIIAVARIFDGITGGNTSVANAYVADITTTKEKSYIFGYLGGIAGIGLIIGPGLGGMTAGSSLGYSGTIITAIIISVIALLMIHFWLDESLPLEKRSKRPRQNILSSILVLRRIREVQPKPLIKLIFGIKTIFSITMSFYIATIPLFIVDLFHFDEKELGTFMLVVGIFLILNQTFISKIFVKKFGVFTTLILGLILAFFGLFCITLTDNFWLYVSFYYVMNLGISLVLPTLNSLISIHANPEKQGEIMGISESLNSMAFAISPIFAAALYGEIGYYLYYIISILPLIGFILAISLRKKVN